MSVGIIWSHHKWVWIQDVVTLGWATWKLKKTKEDRKIKGKKISIVAVHIISGKIWSCAFITRVPVYNEMCYVNAWQKIMYFYSRFKQREFVWAPNIIRRLLKSCRETVIAHWVQHFLSEIFVRWKINTTSRYVNHVYILPPKNAVLMETTIYLPYQDLQVYLSKLECREKVYLFQ